MYINNMTDMNDDVGAPTVETRLANIERQIYQIVTTEKTTNDIIKNEIDDINYVEMRRIQTKDQLAGMVERDRIYAIQQRIARDKLTAELRTESFIESLYAMVAPIIGIMILRWLITG
jgi:hypothetical protein